MAQPPMNQPQMNQAPLNQGPLNQPPLSQPHMGQQHLGQPHLNQPQLNQPPQMGQPPLNQAQPPLNQVPTLNANPMGAPPLINQQYAPPSTGMPPLVGPGQQQFAGPKMPPMPSMAPMAPMQQYPQVITVNSPMQQLNNIYKPILIAATSTSSTTTIELSTRLCTAGQYATTIESSIYSARSWTI